MKAPSDTTDMLTYADLQRLLALPLGTLYSMVARKRIPHVRLGPRIVRFKKSGLLQNLWVDPLSLQSELRGRVVIPLA